MRRTRSIEAVGGEGAYLWVGPFQCLLLALLRAEILEAAIEAGELSAGVEQAVLAAGPGRVRFRVDIEAQRVAFLAIGRAGLVARPVGHHDRDLVVIRVNAFLHRTYPQIRGGI